jgi:hypothetical protein
MWHTVNGCNVWAKSRVGAKASVTGSSPFIRAFHADILHTSARVVVAPVDGPICPCGLTGGRERPMIISMSTTARQQQRYDHRFRELVQSTVDVTVATDLGVPRSPAHGWLAAAPTVVVCLDVAGATEPELLQEIPKLRRRAQRLTARLALTLLRISGFSLTGAPLLDGRAKRRILRAADRAREHLPLQAVLRFLRVSPSGFQVWRRRRTACALDDRSSCPRTSPYRLTPPAVGHYGITIKSVRTCIREGQAVCW